MEPNFLRLFLLSLLFSILISSATSSTSGELKSIFISFLRKLSPSNPQIDRDLGWSSSTDPCLDSWKGISCNKRIQTVRSIVLESLNLNGSIDGDLLSLICNSTALSVLSFKNNALAGGLPPEISNCTRITHLYLSNNRLSGRLPDSLPGLRNLKRLDIARNNFSGDLPTRMQLISGMLTFLANNNSFTGYIRDFDLRNFNEFDVSFNKFSGSVPANSEKLPVSSFAGNDDLCGSPLPVECPPESLPPPPPEPSSSLTSKSPSKKTSGGKAVMVSGYVLFALFIALLLGYKFLKKRKGKIAGPIYKGELNEKKSAMRSEYSVSSAEQSASSTVSTSLVVLRKDKFRDLKFEELLRAPAELLGKGRFGSLYKVMVNSGGKVAELAVKRIKDWTMSREEFQGKMMRMDQGRHPNILPVSAFYCSKQEKLVVYEFQKNESLFKLLHDNKEGRPFPWRSRLHVAAGVSAALSFMHKYLSGRHSATTPSGHGNLKSSNIVFSDAMDPLLSEYGLTALPTHRHSAAVDADPFSPAADVYDFGIVLLELLTGKPSHGFNLAQWVHSVVREEWTAEVFDRSLISDGDRTEEGMMRLLQIALKCITGAVNARPLMAEVSAAISRIRNEEEMNDRDY